MSFREERINEFFNGRRFMAVVAVAYVVFSWLALQSGNIVISHAGGGVFFPSPEALITSRVVSWAVNTVCTLGVCALLITLNRMFNFVRSYTVAYASAFLLLQAGNPMASVQFYVGTALCLVLLGASFVMFAEYQDKQRSQRSIFIAFALVSFCCMFHYSFLFLAPVMLIGFMQMRAMNLRSLIAMVLGLVTPYWIALGMCLVDPHSFTVPQVSTIFTVIAAGTLAHAGVVTAAVTATATVVLTAINMFTIFNYRLQTRLYNAFFAVPALLAIMAMCVDYNNVSTYMPALNLCLAIQVAHTFTISTALRRYLLMVVLIAAAAASYVAQLL